jgi:hypothetical protein
LVSDVVWSPENLDAFLANPREFMPGTKMTFPGLRAAEDRRDLIAYLVAQAPPEEAAAEAGVADPAWDGPEGALAGDTDIAVGAEDGPLPQAGWCMTASVTIATFPSSMPDIRRSPVPGQAGSAAAEPGPSTEFRSSSRTNWLKSPFSSAKAAAIARRIRGAARLSAPAAMAGRTRLSITVR